MRRVFNGGLGYVAVVPPGDVAAALAACEAAGCEATLVGEVVAGEGVDVRLTPCGSACWSRDRARIWER